jgi:excisionase family DNA binding protein
MAEEPVSRAVLELKRVLVSPEEGANITHTSRSQFYKMLATKEIRSIKVGRLRRIPVSEIEAWVERQLEEQSA